MRKASPNNSVHAPSALACAVDSPIPATEHLFARASRVMPGGVTAAARMSPALGRPLYVSRANGPYVYDAEGRELIDVCMSNGATLLGHGHPAIRAAVATALDLGIACAYDGEPQVALAERLVEQVPAFESVRFTMSGTEATYYAIRVARTYTNRRRVLKFEGHFHGYNDPLAFSFWPPPAPGTWRRIPQPETAGLSAAAVDEIVVLPFNDVPAFRSALSEFGDELAAVIMEPINYDSGAILPAPDFLSAVREETTRLGIVLIFDEILSAYRTGPDCAQGYLGVTPDLAVIGKALGGGVPLSVFGGHRDLMGVVAPLGPAVHTGTYNANLVAILAGLGFLDAIAEPGFYPRLLDLSDGLHRTLRNAFANAELPVRVQGVGARFGMFFGLDPDREVTSYEQAAQMDRAMLYAFCREMLDRGVYVHATWHHGLSAAHTEDLIARIGDAAAASALAVANYKRP